MTAIEHQPAFTRNQAAACFRDMFGREVRSVETLPGERDQNFLITSGGARAYVLKFCNPDEPRDFLQVQHEVLHRLRASGNLVPEVITTRDGHEIATVETGSGHYAVRAVTYLHGVPLAQLTRPSDTLLHRIGTAMGKLDAALRDFDHEVLHRDFVWNLVHGIDVVQQNLTLVREPGLQRTIGDLLVRIEQTLSATASDLRRATIHNDANDHNVIVSKNLSVTGDREFCGLIDFGDLSHSYAIGELAILLAYIVCRRDDWLDAACQVVRGFHEVLPLDHADLFTLFDLTLLRLSVSVCMHAKQQRVRPNDPYLAISQEPIRRALPLLASAHPRWVHYRFRDACSQPLPTSHCTVMDWIKQRRAEFFPVMGTRLTSKNTQVMDFSVAGDGEASFAVDVPHPEAAYAIGRYDEPRLIYSASHFRSGHGEQAKTNTSSEFAPGRTIHLGVDIGAPPGTDVFAPVRGEVVVCEMRPTHQDYGGLIILSHQTSGGDCFYTLYGHLSRSCLQDVAIGQCIEAGERVGELGAWTENGGWEPHLHFQLILDLLDRAGEYPGVALSSERGVWLGLSPNPCPLLGIDVELDESVEFAVEGLDVERRHKHISKCLSVAYRDPIVMVRGRMQYLFDDDGRRYLDAYNNVPHVGHCHPRVVAAAARQMRLLNTNTRYLQHVLHEYAERICATLPPSLEVCYFVNSASEANELAIRLAREFTGRVGIVVQESAYHGHTSTLIDVSPYKHAGPGGKGAPAWVHRVPIPDSYRSTCGGVDGGRQMAEVAAKLVQIAADSALPPAAFLAETCPSVGGQIMPPDAYLNHIFQAVREVGAVTIADEVQTGFGRIGTHFWAFERYGVVPDVVVMGKPMGNGHPIAAVVTTRAIATAFENGMEFFSTYGGNSVSCAVGLAVLDVLQEEQLQSRALAIGNWLGDAFQSVMHTHELVGDCRGSGLFWGVELVRDRDTKQPAAEEATYLVNRLRERGVLIGTDGPYHNVLKIRPPMQFTQQDAETLLAVLDESLHEI